jgi:hypothetical protein
MVKPTGAPISAPHQRMVQQGQRSGHRRRCSAITSASSSSKRPATVCGKRLARRIVSLDPPATQQVPITRAASARSGRDHRDPPFGYFQRLADQDRDRLRFLARMRGFHQPHPDSRRLTAGRSTQRALAGGQEQVRDSLAALGRRGGKSGAVPRPHFAAR